MAYWMNDQFFENYGKGVSIASIASYTGSQNITGNNAVYLRYRWEVNSSSATAGETWVPYAKGGDFRRWYGNIDHVVNWSDDARNFYQTNSASNLLAKRYWFKEGITYNAITSARPHFRFLPSGCIFDKGGPSISALGEKLDSVLAFLNSTVCEFYLGAMNPTLNLQVKDIKALPFLVKEIEDRSEVAKITSANISLSKSDWESSELSREFSSHPLV